jgi:uncharacterized protein (TIGR02646 family)
MTRLKASPPLSVRSVSENELKKLKADGTTDHSLWNKAKGKKRNKLIAKFRKEMKEHYLTLQGRKCCFCSIDLVGHHATFTAEHIIPRVTKPQFMFDVRNIAVSCFPCNTNKGVANVLSSPDDCSEMPGVSDAYLIVHPHHDEWTSHLYFDVINRIYPHAGDGKGSYTSEICAFERKNVLRLAAELQAASSKEEYLRARFYDEERSDIWRKKWLIFLRELAKSGKSACATTLVSELEVSLYRGK